MKKTLVLVLTLVMYLGLLTGCGHKLTEGEVYEKEFKEARTQVMMIPIVISNGKSSTTRLIPYMYHYPDRWIVRIRDPNGDGTYVTDEYYTTKEVYDSLDIGDTFCFDPNRDFENEPYTREQQ